MGKGAPRTTALTPAEKGLALLAVSMTIIYILWNLSWLALGQVPPAIFQALTGLPAPTTGGTRSITALLEGDWRTSLRWNAMAVPLLALLGVTVGWLVLLWIRERTLRLPEVFLWLWGSMLLAAWVLKFLVSEP